MDPLSTCLLVYLHPVSVNKQTNTNKITECQQSASRSSSAYASAPNDVWSLGVILVNLTCGRNPWKRASRSDSTYRAYLQDRHFLRTILPVSHELNSILQRIFDPNPVTRITLPELRNRIKSCPRLTNSPNPGMDSPPLSEVSDSSEYYVPESFTLSSPATPTDSAPATPQNQSVQGPFTYDKPLPSYGSDASFASQYYDAPLPESEPAPVPPMDYVTQPARPTTSSFWHFPFLRKNADLVTPHHAGVRIL